MGMEYMKSIKTKLTIFFSLMITISIGIICLIGYTKASDYINAVAKQQFDTKLAADNNVLKKYIENEFGEILLDKGKLMTLKGDSIENDNDVLDKFKIDLGDEATIFKKEGDEFIRVSDRKSVV